MRFFASRIILLAALAIASAAPVFATGTDGTVYDPKILSRMQFSQNQAAKVRSILNRSEVAIVKVFAKYRINPREKPDFDKLRAASAELQAVEALEKRQMKRILSKEQYADYLEILQATAAAVIKATRND